MRIWLTAITKKKIETNRIRFSKKDRKKENKSKNLSSTSKTKFFTTKKM